MNSSLKPCSPSNAAQPAAPAATTPDGSANLALLGPVAPPWAAPAARRPFPLTGSPRSVTSSPARPRHACPARHRSGATIIIFLTFKPLVGKSLYSSVTAVELLRDKQLALGHLVPSAGPRNTPRFVIQKKSGKWRLLQDLQAVNAVMSPMGPLKPGVPNPTMIPEDWPLLVIDLKDCFFTIFLHPDDCAHFAFSVPTIHRIIESFVSEGTPRGHLVQPPRSEQGHR